MDSFSSINNDNPQDSLQSEPESDLDESLYEEARTAMRFEDPILDDSDDEIQTRGPKLTLMSLPTEIRLLILQFALIRRSNLAELDCISRACPRPLVDIARSRITAELFSNSNSSILMRDACWGTASTTNVLLVNRQLKEEAEEVLYGRFAYRVDFDPPTIGKTFDCNFDALSPRVRKLVKHVVADKSMVSQRAAFKTWLIRMERMRFRSLTLDLTYMTLNWKPEVIEKAVSRATSKMKSLNQVTLIQSGSDFLLQSLDRSALVSLK
ncbi:MAG: hypothetical protein M1820_000308 [Bogoriella megaspora]|nr:MAG: hypothetical protein M1820_000308 [Bogoriella megaspora]